MSGLEATVAIAAIAANTLVCIVVLVTAGEMASSADRSKNATWPPPPQPPRRAISQPTRDTKQDASRVPEDD